MKYIGYFYPDMCPLTDEDRAIYRRLCNSIGGAYHGIHQTEQAMSTRRDEWTMKVLADTRDGKCSARRDSYHRLIPPARACI